MTYKYINTESLETCYLEDPGSFLFIAKSSKSFPNLTEALTVFRKSYISASTDEFNPLHEETHYKTFISEMVAFPTEKNFNKREYNQALDMWGTEAPEWLKKIYIENNYLNHLSFQDVLQEGIYESVTKFKNYYLYWCYG